MLFSVEKKEHIMEHTMVQNTVPDFGQTIKRQRMTPPLNERVMLYVRQDNEDVYTPLHVVPPTTMGLLNAVSYNFFFFLIYLMTTNNNKNISNKQYINRLYMLLGNNT